MTCIIASNIKDFFISFGDIIIRASFTFFPEYTAEFLSEVDNELSLILIKKILKKWPNGKFDTLKHKKYLVIVLDACQSIMK